MWFRIPIKGSTYYMQRNGIACNSIGRILTSNIFGGYPGYRLQINNKTIRVSIHRTLAVLFVPGYKTGLQVNHIDGNKLNYALTNLEWLTASENRKHAFRTGLQSTPLLKLSADKIAEIYSIIDSKGLTYTQLGVLYSVNRNTIYNYNVLRRGG